MKENMGIELNFIAEGDGRNIAQVLGSNTGKLIRPRYRRKRLPCFATRSKSSGVFYLMARFSALW